MTSLAVRCDGFLETDMTQAATTTVTGQLTLTRKLPAIAAALFGIFIVWGVGISNSDTLHNAAHDTRHAFAFPCH